MGRTCNATSALNYLKRQSTISNYSTIGAFIHTVHDFDFQIDLLFFKRKVDLLVTSFKLKQITLSILTNSLRSNRHYFQLLHQTHG